MEDSIAPKRRRLKHYEALLQSSVHNDIIEVIDALICSLLEDRKTKQPPPLRLIQGGLESADSL